MDKRIEALMKDFGVKEVQGEIVATRYNFDKFVYAIIEDCCELARDWETKYVEEDCAPKYVDEYIIDELEDL